MLTLYAVTPAQQDNDEDVINGVDAVFDSFVTDEWLDPIWSRKLITTIQDINVMDISRHTREILYAHGLPLEYLACGTKNVLCARYIAWQNGLKIRMGRMGPNCFKWLMDVAGDHDLVATTTIFFLFTEEDMKGREVYFPDIGAHVTTAMEFRKAMHVLIRKGLV